MKPSSEFGVRSSEKILVDTETAARILGITLKAVNKRFERGKMQGELKPAEKGGGKSGMKLFVYIDDKEVRSNEFGVRSSGEKKEDKNRTRVYPGEPGGGIVTRLENGVPIPQVEAKVKVESDDPGAGEIDTSGSGTPSSPEAAPMNLPAISNLPLPLLSKEGSFPAAINANATKAAYLRLAILKAWRDKTSENQKPKEEVTTDFLQVYNSGLFLPHIYNDVKSISRGTLYNWDRAEKSGGIHALTPQYRGPTRSEITEAEKYILLNCLLHQNRLKVGSAIKFTKTFLSYKKIPSPSSESSLRRFADEFKATKYDVWIEAREGAKALNDKCLPYAERDWRLLTVGEGLVADGHRLNFRVVNPFTGKPCRATIVLFWDWKSAYPLGWEIMLEESIQCIASALRNAILCLGKIPKWLLIDNGKAFRANVFTSDIDLEDGITYGMFATLGIHTHFAQAYNPQSKPLERFWGIFNNWFERLLPSYTGASIPDKPAYMVRNEKDAQARHNDWVPKIEELQKMMLQWREFYADQPSRGRDGMKPREILEAEVGNADLRSLQVDPAELEFLMMAKEIKTVHRNGITWNGWHYFGEAMYGYRSKVIVRFSHSDYSQLLVYLPLRKSYCIAKPIEPVHPMASESEFPKDREAVKQIYSLKVRCRRGTKNLLSLIQSPQAKQIDFSRSPDVAKVVEALEDKKPKVVEISAFDGMPEPEMPAQEEKTLRFDEAYDRYDFQLKGEVYKTPEMDRDFGRKYEIGEIAPGEWQAIYGDQGIKPAYQNRDEEQK